MITYADKEQARYWPVSKELMAQYRDGSHTRKSSFGDLIWAQNDQHQYQYHRDGDKPAIICIDGMLTWYQNGQRHRDGDKPAFIGRDSHLEWYKNGDQHRICGPAAICSDGELKWWINGKDITPEVRKWLNRKRWRGTPEQIFEFQLKFV